MDPDPGSQNVADPTDPAPGHEHLFKSYWFIYSN